LESTKQIVNAKIEKLEAEAAAAAAAGLALERCANSMIKRRP